MKRPDSYLVVGAGGALAVAAVVIAMLAGVTGTPEPRQTMLFKLLGELGYSPAYVADLRGIDRPEATVLVREPRSDPGGEQGSSDRDGSLRDFVDGGGVLLLAGSSPLVEAHGLGFVDQDGSLPLSFSDGFAAATAGSEGPLRPEVPAGAAYAPKGPSQDEALAFAYRAGTEAGPCILDLPEGKGRIIAIADASLLSDGRIVDPEVAAVVNGLLAPYWGRKVLFDAGARPRGDAAAVFRLLGSPAGRLIGFQLLLLALLAAGGVAFRFGPLRPVPGGEGKGSAGVAGTFGGFYRRARAVSGADALLAANFRRSLSRLPGAERAGGDAELADFASRKSGAQAGTVMALMKGAKVPGERGLLKREKERQVLLEAIRASGTAKER